MENSITKGLKRNRFVYAFLRITIGRAVCLLRHFRCENGKTTGETALILSSHNSDWDPLMLVIGMKRHMKFVASANILNGFTGRIISFLAGPIPRAKGASADDTVRLIGECLRAGISVGMFPEGNKSWDGRTCFISKRTAELLKETRTALVTWRFDGDYLQTPRWAKYKRRGRVTGRVMREYSPEELESMSVDEIYEAIVRDLDVNAFEYQKDHLYRYRGRKKAEGFENLAWLCPKCLKFGTIRTKGDRIFCSCGLDLLYNDHGFLEPSEGLPGNAYEWNVFQKNYLFGHADELKKKTSEAFRTDDGCMLYRVKGSERELKAADASVRTYGDRFEAVSDSGEIIGKFFFTEIEKMGMFRNDSVYLTVGDERYEISRKSGISGIFYFSVWRVLSGKELY